MNMLLENMTSGDPHRIWASSCAIATLRDPRELDALAANVEAIEAKTAGVPLGGALMPNSEHLKFAIRKLRYWRDKAGCLCRLYPNWLMFDPNKEEKAGNVQIDSTVSDAEKWATMYACHCMVCGTTFTVEEGEYHYTWWKWVVLEAKPFSPVSQSETTL